VEWKEEEGGRVSIARESEPSRGGRKVEVYWSVDEPDMVCSCSDVWVFDGDGSSDSAILPSAFSFASSRIRVFPKHFPPPSSLLSRHVDVLPRPALETVETPVVSSLLVQTPAGLESTPPLRALPRARLHLESRPYSRPDSVEQERHKRSLHLDRLVSGRCLGHVGG
jgi:hypothetical protein